MTEDKEVIVVFERNEGKLIVYHYIENTTEKISDNEVFTDLVGTKIETKPVNVENYVVVGENPNSRDFILSENIQEKTYYYQRQYKVTTDIVNDIQGGTISGKGETSYEDIFKGENNKKEVIIKPNSGFTIVQIKINGILYNYENLLKQDGSVVFPKEFFEDVNENKHIEVEFAKKTKVNVKYLEVETKKVLSKEEVIEGYVGKNYETIEKSIPNYRKVKITNENEEIVKQDGIMTEDEITIIYWYEKIESEIIVKHVEKITTRVINEQTGKEELIITSDILEEELIEGFVGEDVTTNRKSYKNYISAENKNISEGINISKDTNSKTVTFKEDEVIEIVYWYEKVYNITTDVVKHNETNSLGNVVKVKGGTISGEDEIPYEQIVRSYDSTKQIKIVPDDGYRIKYVKINNEEIYIENKIAEDGSLLLDKFTNIQEDKNIKVEFEKIPAKVIVEYKDVDTKENIQKDKILNGFVNEEYNELRVNIDNYVPANPEPDNFNGIMTEETITITYWYTRQFNITTDVLEHNETNSLGNVVKVKGGSISGEDEKSYESILRGDSSTKQIIVKPDSGYKIKEIIVNGEIIEFKDLVKKDKSVELPVFINIQEDKNIKVEFEKIPAKVKIYYLEEGTEKVLYKTEDMQDYEQIEGFVNDKYSTKEKEIEYYELIKEEYPNNCEGIMTEEDITVKYYYKKLLFNMKIEKEIKRIVLNGQNVDVTNKNNAEIEIKYKNINETNLEISYKIKVTNTEKVAGSVIIEESIPDGFEFVQKETTWKEENVGKYVLRTETINPGETKEYEVILKWISNEENKGEKINVAKIAKTINIPNYEETILNDNEDSVTIKIKLEKTLGDILNDIKDEILEMPKTGQTILIYVVCVIIAGLCIVMLVWKKSNKK